MIIVHKTRKRFSGLLVTIFQYKSKIFLSVDSKLCSALDVSSLDINMFVNNKNKNNKKKKKEEKFINRVF